MKIVFVLPWLGVALVACGSSVETTTTTSGTGAGSTSGPAGGAGGTATSASDVAASNDAVSTSTGSTATMCDQICGKLAELNCDGGGADCTTQCEQFVSQNPACAPQASALLTCIAANLTTCDAKSLCQPEMDAYVTAPTPAAALNSAAEPALPAVRCRATAAPRAARTASKYRAARMADRRAATATSTASSSERAPTRTAQRAIFNRGAAPPTCRTDGTHTV